MTSSLDKNEEIDCTTLKPERARDLSSYHVIAASLHQLGGIGAAVQLAERATILRGRLVTPPQVHMAISRMIEKGWLSEAGKRWIKDSRDRSYERQVYSLTEEGANKLLPDLR